MAAHNPSIRVRLRHDLSRLRLSGFALQIQAAHGPRPAALPPVGLAEWQIWREASGGWAVQAKGQPSQHWAAPTLAVKGQMLRLEEDPVPYELELRASPHSKTGVDLVARLDLESYLTGVLASEMPASWPLEALKAQTVAARSYVLRQAVERRQQAYDIDSTIIDQVYTFLVEAQTHPEWKAKIQRAVVDTRGELLLDRQHRVVKAFYSADCGCQSEDPRAVWGQAQPGLKSVLDPSCRLRRRLLWQLQLTRPELESRLRELWRLPPSAHLLQFTVEGRTPTGRVATLSAQFQEPGGSVGTWKMSAQDFRRCLGFTRARSTNFQLQWVGEDLILQGQGYGHGVGLCQTGARSWAQRGATYDEILKLYYPKAQLWTLKPKDVRVTQFKRSSDK